MPDDVHLISSSRDKSILGWDLKSEKRITNHTQPMGGINSFCVNPNDMSKFITVGQERQITFWDSNKTSPEGSLSSSPNPNESDELFFITASPDGKTFATGGSLGIIRVWDFSSGSCLSQ